MNTSIKTVYKKALHSIDWQLLVFLLLFINVKLVVKLVAIIFIYIARPDFSFGLKNKQATLPVFYPLVMLIALLDFFLFKGFLNMRYCVVFLTGMAFWVLCFLAVAQLRIAVLKNKPTVIHQTLFAFFLINCVASFARIFIIMLDAGTINPYRYQGMYQKYFIGTGDLIRGITMDTSTTNAVICAAGVVYFLCRKQTMMTILCMITLLLTGSNLTNMILLTVLLYLFVFNSDRVQKSIMVICSTLLILFMVKVSPQNDKYATGIISKLFSHNAQRSVAVNNLLVPETPDTTNPEGKKMAFAKHYQDSVSVVLANVQLAQQQPTATPTALVPVGLAQQRPLIPQPSIHSQPFQRRRDTLPDQKILINYVAENNLQESSVQHAAQRYPGKLVSFIQAFSFLKNKPAALLTGNGMGNFSSKLAFRATALNISGGYPQRLAYVNNDFRENHLAVFLNFFSRDIELHSVVNTPNSVYNQLAGEYGLAGIAAFLFGYLLFWKKRLKKHSYGIPLLLMLCAIFFVDYWFEQLSVVILFELLFFTDIQKENIHQRSKNTIWKEQLLPS